MKNETPTPETDALLDALHKAGSPPIVRAAKLQMQAQKFERELIDARETEDNDTHAELAAWELLAEARRERDEARKLLEAESRDSVKIAENLLDLERELDDARLNFEAEKERGDTNAAAFWKAEELLTAERALADRLVAALNATRWDSPVACRSALTAWKEARK